MRPAERPALCGRAATSNDGPELEEQRADAIVDLSRGYLQHRPRTLGSAYELVVITTLEQLEQGSEGVGGYLPDGSSVPKQVARMLAADGARVDAVMGQGGELLDVGRRIWRMWTCESTPTRNGSGTARAYA